jgi:hypothetical protein
LVQSFLPAVIKKQKKNGSAEPSQAVGRKIDSANQIQEGDRRIVFFYWAASPSTLPADALNIQYFQKR